MRATTEQPKLRVLFVVNDGWFFLSHRLPIAKALIADGHDVHLAANQDLSRKQIEGAGIQCHDWNLKPRSIGVVSEVVAFISLLKIFVKCKPSTLHLVTIKPVLYGGALARFLNIPNVVFAISGLGYVFSDTEKSSKPLKILAKQLYKFVLRHKNSAVIVQNTEDKRFFTDTLRVDEKSVYQLPGSGVDIDLYVGRSRPEKPIIILLGSRMLWDKGIQEFADAAAIIKRRHPDILFRLVGYRDPNNPRSVNLDALNDWQKRGILEWQGHSDDMPGELASASIFCLPTAYGEGVPKVLLEACACECAVVVSDWPGCREIIIDKQNGLLVPARDSNALADAILTLINNPAERKKLGQSARQSVVSGFTVQHVIDQTKLIYIALNSRS